MPPPPDFVAEYNGQMLSELGRLVDRAMRFTSHQALCRRCGMPLGSHSTNGRFCPNWMLSDELKQSQGGPYWQSSQFRPLICEYEYPETRKGVCDGVACEAAAVVFHLASERFVCRLCFYVIRAEDSE